MAVLRQIIGQQQGQGAPQGPPQAAPQGAPQAPPQAAQQLPQHMPEQGVMTPEMQQKLAALQYILQQQRSIPSGGVMSGLIH